jgi:hypothetical protein
VINNGDRIFEEFLEVLEDATRFKEWLRNRSPDEDVVAAYLQKVASVVWLGRIPGKSLRYTISASAGQLIL